ncbi:MAG: lipoprotein insertase outer membrane protein LolB [Pseudomonadota bacterium]
MKLRGRSVGWTAALAALLLVQGCATPRQPSAPAGQVQAQAVSGRLALQVEGQAGQSFSASFELRGAAQAGELELFSPLGSTLAKLSWDANGAALNNGGKTQQFTSLDALAAAATGTPIPIAALFDWLAGTDTAVPGWRVDLSQLQQGRIHARRLDPPPVADLRVAIER